jgi:hypothetical protein
VGPGFKGIDIHNPSGAGDGEQTTFFLIGISSKKIGTYCRANSGIIDHRVLVGNISRGGIDLILSPNQPYVFDMFYYETH